MKIYITDLDSKPDDSLIEQVGKVLSNHCAGARVRIDGPISVRNNSEIFHAVIETATPFEVGIKLCLVQRTKTPDQSAAREQFLALERADKALKASLPRCRTPTPIFFAPELAAFAMSWIDGESLTRKMHRASIFTKGPDWFEEVGAWLGGFHKAGPIRSELVNLDERLGVINNLLASPLPDKGFSSAILILQQNTAQVENVEAETSWLHGDCKTDNFLLNDHGAYGIDISLSHENSVEYDLAQFLNNLGLIFVGPQHIYLTGMQSKLENAFWRGYQRTGPAVSHTYLNWLRLNFSLFLWHTTLKGRKQSIRYWVLNQMFAKLTNRLAGIVEKSN